MRSVIREYISEAVLLLEEALFVVFGDVIYDIGVKRIIVALMLIVLIVCAVLVFRYLRRRYVARFGKLDRIAAQVEEHSRLLRQLLDEKDVTAHGDEVNPDR